MKNKIILRTEKLTQIYGALRACDEVSLEIYENEIHAVIGPNGAGKTTLMDLIVKRRIPVSGKVYFREMDITKKPPYDIVKLGICKCFQISNLFMEQTCFENIRLALIVKQKQVYNFLPKPDGFLREEAEKILELVGIAHLSEEIAAFLSYGDQRRLEIAITLAMEPKLLLMDEPTAGVSRSEGLAIMSMINNLVREKNITVVFIEHNMDIIFNFADRISVMNHGILIATDTPINIKKNEFVRQAYMGGDSK